MVVVPRLYATIKKVVWLVFPFQMTSMGSHNAHLGIPLLHTLSNLLHGMPLPPPHYQQCVEGLWPSEFTNKICSNMSLTPLTL